MDRSTIRQSGRARNCGEFSTAPIGGYSILLNIRGQNCDKRLRQRHLLPGGEGCGEEIFAQVLSMDEMSEKIQRAASDVTV